jgi:hypothetical protein
MFSYRENGSLYLMSGTTNLISQQDASEIKLNWYNPVLIPLLVCTAEVHELTDMSLCLVAVNVTRWQNNPKAYAPRN